MPSTKRVNAGKLLPLQHVRKDVLELGNDEDHQHAHDDDGHDHDGAGIKHGGDDFAFDLLRLFHELGKAVEHDFQHAAQFAGLDHVHEQAVENLGMLRQALGKRAAAFDGQAPVRR